ncbi:MAG TPA: Ig-like domain-containing protein, partial [Gemmatimonadaceae bacterium]|nr:Ig-like domain-containing protein [Gemmatimonadaceae bacterium]
GSSYGPPGSAFFQGVQQGDGKLILTFLPNTTAIPTVTTATATPNPVQRNATTRLTASVAYKAPATGTVTGLVVFSVDGVDVGPPVPLQNGVAQFDYQASLAAGRHALSVRFLGSTTVGASGTSVPLDVQ